MKGHEYGVAGLPPTMALLRLGETGVWPHLKCALGKQDERGRMV